MGLLHRSASAQSPGDDPSFRGQYSYNYQKQHIFTFQQNKVLIMKKQTVKKWIKDFFNEKQQKTPPTSSIETTSIQKKHEGWTEAEAEIVNQLINMDSLIKISRHLNEFEFATLYSINEILCQENIDMVEARKSLVGGIRAMTEQKQIKYTTRQLPFQYYSVRSLLWKICIGYLTSNCKQKWISFMQRNLAQYKKYIHQFIIQPIQKKLGLSGSSMSPELQVRQKQNSQGKIEDKGEKIKDHPLNFSQQSKWGSYFKDMEIWNTIQKDVKRTRKSCKFFEQAHQLDLEQEQMALKPNQVTFSECREQTYADSLTRIIFIYLKRHPGQVYVQGMNQLVALIYYCFTNKNSEYFRRVSESDTYFVFEIIMGKMPKKHFQKGQDYVKQFLSLMKKLDLRLYEEIQKNNGLEMIKLSTMKWFISGFLTEYNIDECLLIWDVFIAWPAENTLLTTCFNYMALSLVHLNRDKLMQGENVALVFSKITNPPAQLVEKTQSLFKLFPKLLQK